MTGQAYINNKDIFLTWGMTLISGAYEALLTPAPMKDYIENKSRGMHGSRIVAAAENARMDSRNVSIPFFIEGATEAEYLTRFESFITEITSGMFTLKIPRMQRSFKLVYTECSKYGNYGMTRGKFIAKFKEPNPKDRTY